MVHEMPGVILNESRYESAMSNTTATPVPFPYIFPHPLHKNEQTVSYNVLFDNNVVQVPCMGLTLDLGPVS